MRPIFAFVAALGAAGGLELLAAANLDAVMSLPWRLVVGLSLTIAGITISAVCWQRFTTAGNGLMPDEPARILITDGPYAVSRNPMFVGIALTYAGAALVANLGWAFVLLPAVVFLISTTVIRREEQYLTRIFGSDYLDFCRRTPRWL